MTTASPQADKALTDAMIGLTLIESILTNDHEKYQLVMQGMSQQEVGNSLIHTCVSALQLASHSMDIEVLDVIAELRSNLMAQYAAVSR